MGLPSTVIIVSYRPGEWLEPSVRSALSQASEVIVVDNGSDGEEASSVARQLGAQTVRCHRNMGFAGGVCAGLEHARGEIVGLLNDDATAGPTWLQNASRILDDVEIGAVTPKVLLQGSYVEVMPEDEPWQAPGDARILGRRLESITVGDVEVLDSAVGAGIHDIEHGDVDGSMRTWRWTAAGKPMYLPLREGSDIPPVKLNGEAIDPGPVVRVINHVGSYLRGHGIAGEYGLGAPDDGRFDQPAERFGFSGTAPVFRAETLRRLGSFAPEFFAYNEDTDWCLRARLAGLRIMYDPGASVTHRLSSTSGGPKQERVRFLARRNALLCLVRNAPAGVARQRVLRRIREGPGDDGVRRALLRRLPWAVRTRFVLRRTWVTDPHTVWNAWADQDLSWDDYPAEAGR